MDIGDIKYLEVPAKVTKLSEAIRIGAKIRPQHFGIRDKERYPDIKRSCALGAASEGMTGQYEGPCGDTDLLHKHFSAIILSQVWHKNDFDRASREEIADWLESQGY